MPKTDETFQMKQITVKCLALQFDANQITSGSDSNQAQQAIDLVNQTLQREPFGLGAQLLVVSSPVTIESEERE